MTVPTQVPRTFFEFQEQFANDEHVEEWFVRWRWPEGVRCPSCSSLEMTRLRTRRLWQCRSCRKQCSVTSGTAMHRTKVPLRVWAYALWLMGTRRVSVSALQLQRETGLGSYETAWWLLHKVRATLDETKSPKLSRGVIETDESMVGGSDGRKARRLGRGGRWLIVAVERTQVTKTARNGDVRSYMASGSVRAEVATAVSKDGLARFITSNIEPGATVGTDGWNGYHQLTGLGYRHEKVVQGVSRPKKRAVVESSLPKVHLFFSNLKAWLNGTFHGVSGRYLRLYVQEHTYRFNRRSHGPKAFGWLTRRLVSAQPRTRVALAEATG